MPGEVITIDPANYPELEKIEDGEQVELKVVGTKATNDDGSIEITTDSIEQMNMNPAKKSLKDLKKGSMPKGSMSMDKEDAIEDAVTGGGY